jgi:quercetin dioxygenase-like cupin family protein
MIENDKYVLIRAADVKPTKVTGSVLKGGSSQSSVAYSPMCSLAVTTRAPGFHSRARVHEGDELDYCVSGEIVIFVGDEGITMREGDFLRIRGGAVHWGIVTSDKPCTLVHIHTPPYIGNPGVANTAKGALFPSEKTQDFPTARDVFSEDIDTESIERKFFDSLAVA